jgi:CRISPR/Cas system CSM-associated protein Csm3 (group 7 of RAMP superfamily)
MKFKRRWLIVGTLTTHTPLHIGSGENADRDEPRNEKTKERLKIAGVARNKQGTPYIPSSTLKGNLRAWSNESGLNSHSRELFGSEDTKSPDAIGGKAEFLDAHATFHKPFKQQLPYWDETRWTAVTASTAINRNTRTVLEDHLFHQEFVPPGVVFEVRIGGQDAEGDDDDELIELLALLEGFKHGEVSLGAETANGWGLFGWDLTDVRFLAAADVTAWLSSEATGAGYEMLSPVSPEVVAQYRQRADARVANNGSNCYVELAIALKFDTNFLVNDPCRAKSEDKYDHVPLLDEHDLPLLPARSFRGALRSQAERILRTIGGDRAACQLGANECQPIYQKAGVKTLCMACQLFGAPGWRSPVRVTPFTPISNDAQEAGTTFHQEFVAIDRFKGGGADKLKFNAESVYGATLKGKIGLDLDALTGTGAEEWAVGLLALTLRDLSEGDVTFGFGAGKGYGSCIGKIESFKLPQVIPPGFLIGIGNDLQIDDLKTIVVTAAPKDVEPFGLAIGIWLENLSQQCGALLKQQI